MDLDYELDIENIDLGMRRIIIQQANRIQNIEDHDEVRNASKIQIDHWLRELSGKLDVLKILLDSREYFGSNGVLAANYPNNTPKIRRAIQRVISEHHEAAQNLGHLIRSGMGDDRDGVADQLRLLSGESPQDDGLPY